MHATTAKPPPPPAASGRVDPAVRRLTITLIIGALAVIFDTTIMSVATGGLAGRLHTSLTTAQWVTTAYLLALSAAMPTLGWAQAVLGGKRLWITALGLFFLGSLLCAAAWDIRSLIAFRVVQGVGGGIMMVLMTTLIMQAAQGRDIGRVMSLITVPTALGPVLGPVLGGVLLHLGDWRWIFLFNIPFCLLGGYLAWRDLPADQSRPVPRPRLDAVGMLLLSPGLAAVIYGLTQLAGPGGSTALTVALPLAGGLALLLGYVWWALRRGPRAMLDLRLLRHRSLASSSALVFLSGAALYGTMLLLPLYWQQVRGQSALDAALLLIPQGVGTLLSRTLAGRYMDRFGSRPVALVSLAAALAATVPFGFITASTSDLMLMAVLFVRGLGLGAAMIAIMGAAFVGLGREQIPAASSISRVTQQVGGSVGVAVLVMILQRASSGAHSPAALASGFADAFWWSAAFTAAAIPLCLLLPGRPNPQPTTPTDEHPPA
ncbi:MDR family MFS transporter [Actinomadura rupiterrae]|uniref:MDR family MFS transporter n=1 Tax=Actinomadura rupiterrae TaxID=559627 RepID=UPI0020A368F3|nr:MDR family MFS transporter [Actinomadura rupiterrae]MCP2342153.1 EmrB/QacA subfamily drug resistance transporter [Actinomadura rupiterrae]